MVSKGNYTSDIEMSGNATTNLIPDQTSAEIMSARDAFETLHGTRNKLGLYAIQDFTQFSIYQDVVGKPFQNCLIHLKVFLNYYISLR